MKTYKTALAFDPSGSFNEGKGTTGWCLMRCGDKRILKAGIICAAEYSSMESYWDAHIKLIQQLRRNPIDKPEILVIEDYLLYQKKRDAQINSRMETCKLIGALQYYCFTKQFPYYMQTASEVKERWTDEILLHKKIIAKYKRSVVLPHTKDVLSKHTRDAIRHAVHFSTFKNGGV